MRTLCTKLIKLLLEVARREPAPGHTASRKYSYNWQRVQRDRGHKSCQSVHVWARAAMRARTVPMVNPFTHRIETASRLLAMSEPSAATARLQVIRMSCDLAGPLPATRLLSHNPGFERLDRAGHGCFMMRDAPRVLRKATDVNTGFRYARIHDTQPPR